MLADLEGVRLDSRFLLDLGRNGQKPSGDPWSFSMTCISSITIIQSVLINIVSHGSVYLCTSKQNFQRMNSMRASLIM